MTKIVIVGDGRAGFIDLIEAKLAELGEEVPVVVIDSINCIDDIEEKKEAISDLLLAKKVEYSPKEDKKKPWKKSFFYEK